MSTFSSRFFAFFPFLNLQTALLVIFAATVRSDPLPGSLDPAFNPSFVSRPGNPIIYSIAVQTDGQIVAGGDFTSVNGVSRQNLCRLTPYGQLDLQFGLAAGADAPVRAVLIQPDGRIVVAGEFTHLNGAGWNRSSGAIDSTFISGPGARRSCSLRCSHDDRQIADWRRVWASATS